MSTETALRIVILKEKKTAIDTNKNNNSHPSLNFISNLLFPSSQIKRNQYFFEETCRIKFIFVQKKQLPVLELFLSAINFTCIGV